MDKLHKPHNLIADPDHSTAYRRAMEQMGVAVSFTRGVSMRPLIWSGRHYVAIVPVDEPQIGDILLFEQMRRGEVKCILHRLVDIDTSSAETVYVTRGDNCPGCERVSRHDILGKVNEIWRTGRGSIRFAVNAEHFTVDDPKYLRYVRFWDAIWPARRLYYKVRGAIRSRLARIPLLRRLKQRFF